MTSQGEDVYATVSDSHSVLTSTDSSPIASVKRLLPSRYLTQRHKDELVLTEASLQVHWC
jgi:hypothetical protein